MYNSEYQELCKKYIYGNKAITNLATTGLNDGTYYIKVDSSKKYEPASSDVYTINVKFCPSIVWEKEFNEDFTSATNINLETTYYGTT